MFLGSLMTPGDGTLQIKSNIRLFETCCRIWHSFLNFVGDIRHTSPCWKVFISLLYKHARDNTWQATWPHTRFSLFLVLNMTCYKRQKFVKFINLHNWQLWKKKPGKSALREMLQLNGNPGEVCLHILVINLQLEMHVLCCVGFADQHLLCITLRIFWALGLNAVAQAKALQIPCAMAWPQATKPMGLSAALHF